MYISVVTLHVTDVERAIRFYTEKLGWEKTMDAPMGPDARWVTVAPPTGQAAFVLAKSPAATIGEMSGVIFEIDDVYRAHRRMTEAGIEFAEPPRTEPWGGWAMFRDSEGNTHGLHSCSVASGQDRAVQ